MNEAMVTDYYKLWRRQGSQNVDPVQVKVTFLL